jgi:tetratricopeptide (TPR) repeat protein
MAKAFLRSYNREIETMIDRGQLDEAIAHCHHILKTFPKHLETYRLLGKAYLEGKRYADAVDVFSRVLASVPNDFVSHVGLSIIRDEENKLDDAIWHMERAFETQPSNAAIQSELQRLYGRRDGVRPPRIRMTRGALAHMYVQGELYPQAISEIKSVLKEDPGRSDMQALLARANFKSGAKNDAVDAALALLQRYPYALDGNRVLVEVLSADRNENAQAYRQRLVELDPYAAQVSNSVFLSNEVADAAVSLERLDWNGQPVGIGSDWRESQAIGLESGKSRDEQPDWLKASAGTVTPPPLSEPVSGFGFETPSTASANPAQPADEIPDFMKSAGWGQSTGTFDESKSMFANEEPAAAVEPLAEGDLPDWVKAMKPPEPAPEPAASAETEEELPDWINKIGTGALGTADSQADWMSQSEQTQEQGATAQDDEPDWLKGFGTAQESAQAAEDQPNWLKGFGSESEVAPQPAQTDTPDWLTGFGSESEPDLAPQAAQTDTPDWLKGIETESETPAAQSEDDWMKQLGSTPQESALPSEELDFLKELTPEPLSQPAQEFDQPMSNVDDLVKSESEQEDSFAWLEDLGAKQQDEGQTFMPNPEELMEPQSESAEQVQSKASEPPVSQPSANVDELGKSEQERDDSFAWLESLAAKQGASEGLLTKPEERLEQEPEWVRQAKGLTTEIPVSPPSMNAEELGKSDQERDDSFAWLESLAAKQGASEGLLTKPEERLEEEPEWVKQAKGLAATPPPAPVEAPVTPSVSSIEEPGPTEQIQDDTLAWLETLGEQQGEGEALPITPEESLPEQPEWMEPAAFPAAEPAPQVPASIDELGKSDQERDDSFAWLENLAAKQGATEGLLTKPEERLEQEPEWVRQAKDQGAQQPVTPSAQEEPAMEQPAAIDDTAAWLKSLEAEKQPEPASEADQTAIWFKNLAEEEKQAETIPAADETAMWLKNLEQEEQQAAPVASSDETAMWLKSLEQDEYVAGEQTTEPLNADIPAWMKDIDQDETSDAERTAPVQEAQPTAAEMQAEETDVPSWLGDLDKEERSAVSASALANDDDLPSWLREDTGDVVAEPLTIEPTRPSDWKSAEPQQPEIQYSPALEETKQPEIIYSPPLEEPVQPEPEMAAPVASFEEQPAPPRPPEETPKPAPQAPSRPATPQQPHKEPVTRKGTGMLVMPGIDPMLGTARSELSRSNIPGALESYARLIKKGRYLDEVIYDLREALDRYPVEVSIWQSLGDAYMRSNRLQDALDAYTKAEELLR